MMQHVETFAAGSDDRGRSEGNAHSKLGEWLQESPHMRIAAMTGDMHFLIAVVEPRPAAGERS